jgi:hypothetical protein
MSYAGTYCECGSPKRPRTEACTSCTQREAIRHEGPSERLARILQREGEWMLATDVATMGDADRVQVSTTLVRLAQRGVVEQTWCKGVGMVYRAKRRAA